MGVEQENGQGERRGDWLGLVFLAAAGLLIASTTIIFSIGQIALNSNRVLASQREIIAKLEQLASTVKSAETGQRGYLLTGQSDYLEPYHRAVSALPGQLEDLSRLAISRELSGNQVAELTRLVQQKLAELEQTVKLYREGSPKEALDIVRSDRGRQLMDAIRSQLANMEADEVAEFLAANRRAAHATQTRNAAILAVALLNLGFLAWAYFRLKRYLNARHQAEEALARSKARQDAVINSAMDAIISVNAEQRIVLFNPAAEKMFGVSSREAMGSPINRFIPERFREAHTKHVENFGRTGTTSRRMGALGTLSGLRATGEEFPIEASISHTDVYGEKLFTVVLRDVTERKQMEEELRKSHNELELRVQQRTADLADANRELEAFGYSVSHDLRAPLRHIGSYIRLLEKNAGPSLDETTRRQVRIIDEAAQRMGHLIDDLLVLSRIGRTALSESTVSLPHLVDQARKELGPEMVGRAIEWQIGPLPQVRGDPNLLRSVVVNLLSNALKYTRHRNPASIEVGSTEQDNEVVCFVRDNGAGFDMRFVDKLFGVFQRLHDQGDFEGTGIGLASVRRVVQRHGGRTWAEGEVDKGATFYFSLPKRRVV